MKPFQLLTLYLRREPTTDPILAGAPFPKGFDVVAYSTRADVKTHTPKARWGWYQSSKPTRRNRRVTLNCYQWAVVWLPDLDA